MTDRAGIRAWVGLLLMILGAGAARGAGPETPVPGQLTPRVQCRQAPDQSYALYLPSGYRPEQRWPLLLAFDPAGRGRVPVERFQAAAQRYGYIVAGSNNARNGPWEPVVAAVNALWTDIPSRFSIDPDRVYAAGFSGGARVACAVALSRQPGPVAGVVACGAGLPVQQGPPREIDFALFGTVGTRDFNYRELLALDGRAARRRLPHRLEVFDGGHEWASPELCERALAWFELLAMKAGRRARDEALLTSWLQEEQSRAETLAGSGQTLAAVRLLEAAAADFTGLRDVAPLERQATALRKSAAFREEQKADGRREKLEEAFHQKLVAVAVDLRESGSRLPAPEKIVQRLKTAEMQQELEKNPDAGEKASLLRRLNLALSHFSETAQTFSRNREFPRAILCQECVIRIRPDSAPARYNLACLRALAGESDLALAALAEALDRGFADRALLAEDPDLASLRSRPEFQQLLNRLAAPLKQPAPTP